ncbi:MAG: hypothetical protein LBE35_11665 [Clostridiales bacterium]|jgi:hypothetical protein|nr:hypothetical protein [Clostridiales bacterium]
MFNFHVEREKFVGRWERKQGGYTFFYQLNYDGTFETNEIIMNPGSIEEEYNRFIGRWAIDENELVLREEVNGEPTGRYAYVTAIIVDGVLFAKKFNNPVDAYAAVGISDAFLFGRNEVIWYTKKAVGPKQGDHQAGLCCGYKRTQSGHTIDECLIGFKTANVPTEKLAWYQRATGVLDVCSTCLEVFQKLKREWYYGK